MDNDINTNYCAFENCNHKLKLIDFPCKCKKIYCKIHKLPEYHNCVYDYKENNNKQNKIKIMKCILDKIDKI
tara:strand:- start:22503 stop:22718 length:216 start_codon:yes stop_codon:yes gene_type:complete